MDGSEFVYYWITFAVLVPAFSIAVFFLSRKAGFFKDQGRLRYLALWAEVPVKKEEGSTAETQRRGENKIQKIKDCKY